MMEFSVPNTHIYHIDNYGLDYLQRERKTKNKLEILILLSEFNN